MVRQGRGSEGRGGKGGEGRKKDGKGKGREWREGSPPSLL